MEGMIGRYTPDNLELLHKAFSKLIDTLIGFARNNPRAKTKDIVYKLGISDKESWQKLKDIFDEGSLYEAFDPDSADPIQVLVSIFNSMDDCHNDLLQHTKEWEAKEGVLNAEIEDLKDQKDMLTVEVATLQHKLRLGDSSARSSENTISMLDNKIIAKDARIAELERGGNVVLWEKEKERAFEAHIAKEAELTKQLDAQKIEMKLQCERYEKKIMDYSDENHRLKLQLHMCGLSKEDIKIAAKTQQMTDEKQEVRPDRSGDMDDLKRKVYYLAKDLMTAEKEISRLQKEISGVLQGVERDFRIVHHKMVDNKELTMKHMNKVADWLSNLHKAFREGTMAKVLAELPDYYRSVDTRDLKPIKIRLSKGGTSGKQLESMVKSMEKDVWDIETEKAQEEFESRQLRNGGPTTQIEMNGRKMTRAEHPQLIYDNGKVNTTALIKHFPSLSVAFVQEQWTNFRRYDRNGDGTLDLAEMMTAITATMGHRFTAHEVVDVMAEVDDDQSSTLDFYEFLKVAVIISKKTGKASLFQDDEVVKNKKQLSKTCLIQ